MQRRYRYPYLRCLEHGLVVFARLEVWNLVGWNNHRLVFLDKTTYFCCTFLSCECAEATEEDVLAVRCLVLDDHHHGLYYFESFLSLNSSHFADLSNDFCFSQSFIIDFYCLICLFYFADAKLG